MELVSQFTEDAVAKEDRVCGRPACRSTILKGAPCYYVATIVPGQPGRFVCEACYLRYSQKLSTSVRPSSVRPSSAQSQLLPNPHIIRQTVNAAQRKSTINPPRVVPFLSQPSSSTAHIGRISGPDIAVPLSWQQSPASSNPNMVSGAAGYSVHHAQYGLERERWAKLAYAPPPAETITLEISAVYEGNSRKKSGRGINFGNICEGKKDIDARLDAPGLIQIALDTILPKILTFGRGFPWRTEEFVVRDATWVDLSGHLPAIPYFLAQCLVQSRRGPKTTTFKTKQFLLMVVVPAAQWSEYEAWLDKTEEEISQNILREQLQRHRSIITVTEERDPRTSGTNSDDPWAAQQEDEDPFGLDFEGPDALSTVGRNSTVTDSSAHNPTRPSAKRAHVRRESDSTNSTVSPPRKKPAPGVFHLPDRNDLKEALKSGGSVDAVRAPKVYDFRNEDIQFHPIPVRPLADILKTPQYRSFKPNISNSSIGQLTIDVPIRSMIGIGAFKTAHPGWLTLSPLSSSGLGSRAQQDVVVKRPFHRPPPHTPGSSILKISRYALPDEHEKLLNECNLLYWAKSLLDFTYEYIDHCINAAPTLPSFPIPRVRFVEAGIALAFSRHSSNTQGTSEQAPMADIKAGMFSAVYLLEERVTSGTPNDQTFVKFIHNKDYGPSLDEDEYGYDLAVFLSFTQHIQYEKTEGLAFISDYQGSTELLTDPQILTHRSVNEGIDLFGDGNIASVVDDFKARHLCNHYCKWPGFELEVYA
ncbi:hypothetical protein DFJ58DRAFT_848508 [Suillus subalutaceus]|uniref:uncharacterized protein n=1 Tax=Suillus subalutaceus TaxID=48586 RepID=UPI001B866404|nr:uncharacterized protein DFJ58DRAFT_848508 [Suillus subalutaceus]KAG1830255.1 hypothetical protein DFJ58DRAFT_848508 [Suillus subalutaceus]